MTQQAFRRARPARTVAFTLRLTVISLAGNSYDVAFDGNIVRGQIDERWRPGCRSIVQLEAGMMPWTTDGFADENSLVERGSVMRALPADGEPVRLDMDE